jgi:hypothetical protein
MKTIFHVEILGYISFHRFPLCRLHSISLFQRFEIWGSRSGVTVTQIGPGLEFYYPEIRDIKNDPGFQSLPCVFKIRCLSVEKA